MKPSWKGQIMSRIGSYNLALQEQAEELGFETTQQALDAGCVVEGDCDQPVLVEPLELAHRAWEKERDGVLENLAHLLNIYKGVKPDEDIIEDAIKFIEEAHE